MTREEAINEVRSWSLPKETREILEALIPELRESDDERIRVVILKLVLGMRDEIFTTADKLVTKPKVLAWLKKQKEPVVDKEGMYYYLGGKFIYCGYPATEENPYDFAMSQQEKQEQKPSCRNSLVMTHEIIMEKQEEQKEIPLMNGDADLYFDNWIQHNDTTKRGCFEEGIRYAQRLQKEQKQEWSDEDERIRQGLIEMYKNEHLVSVPIGVHSKDIIRFLENLRPSWKPSKEDLMMLEHIIEQYEIGNKNSKVMGYLPRVEELSFLKKVLSKWKN